MATPWVKVTVPQARREQGAKGQSFLRDLLRRLIRERPVGAVSGVIVLLLCLVAIFADLLAPYHFMEMTMIDRLKGPSSTYPLGTDHIGRDLSSAACCTGRGCRWGWGSPPPR